MYRVFACIYDMYVCYLCAWCLQRSGEGVRSPETVVTYGCKSPLECRELNLSTLKEAGQMLLATKPPDSLACIFSFIRFTFFSPLY